MQFREKEYYGEIWFPENEGDKHFCVLKRENNKLRLTTKLSDRDKSYTADLILGVFTGLGYLTFINNNVVNSVSGMITSKSYSPEYCLIGSHFLNNPREFRTLKVSIVNSDLRKWIWLLLFDLYKEDNTISYENIQEEINIDEDLLLSFYTWVSTTDSRNDYILQVNSNASVSFDLKKSKSIVEIVDIYNKFQKFLLFFYGSTKQFEGFNLVCEGCNESFELFYKDGFHSENRNSLLNLNYQDLREDLNNLIVKWFTNNDILICVDKILNNTLSSKLSYSQKFINAYISLESFLKRFCNSNGKDFKVHLEKNQDIILLITSLKKIELDEYLKKIVRTRDYYVHDNVKQKQYFKGIDLLYESIMLEYLVSILLLKELGGGEIVINKVIQNGNLQYVNFKELNIRLNRDILKG